jgi:hypothetical protein
MRITRLMPLSGLCRFWAAVFLMTGIGFAVTPHLIADLLNSLAAALKLTPGIPTERDTLWYALALSLMATISYLSWEASRPGAAPSALRAVLLSKAVSTIAFSVAALTLASGWWLCAFADAFVAATLIVAWRAQPVPRG